MIFCISLISFEFKNGTDKSLGQVQPKMLLSINGPPKVYADRLVGKVVPLLGARTRTSGPMLLMLYISIAITVNCIKKTVHVDSLRGVDDASHHQRQLKEQLSDLFR